MKIADIIVQIESKKINNYKADLMLTFFNFIDNHIALIKKETFTPHTSINDEANIPQPFINVYEYYIMAQIDMMNQEWETYNNYIALYNGALDTYIRHLIRNELPIITTKITV